MTELALPPVVERIRRKGVSEEEIRKFVRDNVRMSRDYFSALTTRFVKALEDSAWRFVKMPDDDPYWRTAPRSQNFMDALARFIENRLAANPEDELLVWAWIGLLANYGMTRTFGGQYWLPLVVKNPHNVRWAIDSALLVWHDCGKDETDDLLRLLRTIELKIPGFRSMLQRNSGNEDAGLAATSRVALGILDGARLSDYRRPWIARS